MNTVNNWRYQRAAASAAAAPDPLPLGTVIRGDALTQLRRLPEDSVDCIITSPPYHMLRRYDAGPAELGTEPHIERYVDRLLTVCDELARVLTPHGGMWLNLGDSFSRGSRYGAPAKSMLLAPERILLALAERGWIVRNKAVWAKPNPMPHSVRDRLTVTWEPLYFLVRSPSYFFDLDAIRQPHRTKRTPRQLKGQSKYGGTRPPWAGPLAGVNDGLDRARAEGRPGHPLGKNPGDVWQIATAGFRGAHFAVFPEELVRRALVAGCPTRVCAACGRPWQREPRRDHLGTIQPACGCKVDWRRGRVLDPFIGSGTVAVVAERLQHDWIGIELNPAFAAMAETRAKSTRTNERRNP